jgi:hypothetical protein
MSFEIGTALNGGLYVAGHSFGNVYGGIIESGVRADFSGRITISGGLISGESSVILTFLQPEGQSPESSSPGGSHPQALPEPYVNLSAHTAHIIQSHPIP